MLQPIYEHKGYKYLGGTEQDYDGDDGEGCPIILEYNTHDVLKPDGERTSVDFSRWQNMSEADFRLWVDLGCPHRGWVASCGPLDSEDLMALAVETAHS